MSLDAIAAAELSHRPVIVGLRRRRIGVECLQKIAVGQIRSPDLLIGDRQRIQDIDRGGRNQPRLLERLDGQAEIAVCKMTLALAQRIDAGFDAAVRGEARLRTEPVVIAATQRDQHARQRARQQDQTPLLRTSSGNRIRD